MLNVWTCPLPSSNSIIMALNERQFELNLIEIIQLRDKLNEEIKRMNGDWEITYG